MQYTIQGSKYGIAAGDFVIDVPSVVDGIPLYSADGTDNFPRNEAEKQMLGDIIMQFQKQQNTIDNTNSGGGLLAEKEDSVPTQMEQFRQMQIKDPITHKTIIPERTAFGRCPLVCSASGLQ